MSNQSARHAAVNAILGISGGTYEGSFHAMFDADSIATGTFNGRLLAWLNAKLEASYTSLPGAQHAFAVSLGFADWNSLNTWEALASYDEDAQAYFDAAGVTNETYLDAINQFILDLKAASLWTKFDRLWILANEDATAALTCIKSLETMTPINAPTFTAGQGYAGNGTSSYLDTNFAPDPDGVNYLQNAASIGLYSRTSGGSGRDMGCAEPNPDPTLQLLAKFDDGNVYGWINSANDFTAVANADASGLYLLTRTAAGATRVDRNGSSIQTATAASNGRPAASMALCCVNDLGTGPLGHTTRQYAMAFIGGAFSAPESTALDTCVDTLKASIGF
jgi:hypothetical protein